MLKKIMNEVDTNGDGRIQYEGMLFVMPRQGLPFQRSFHYADSKTTAQSFEPLFRKRKGSSQLCSKQSTRTEMASLTWPSCKPRSSKPAYPCQTSDWIYFSTTWTLMTMASLRLRNGGKIHLFSCDMIPFLIRLLLAVWRCKQWWNIICQKTSCGALPLMAGEAHTTNNQPAALTREPDRISHYIFYKSQTR